MAKKFIELVQRLWTDIKVFMQSGAPALASPHDGDNIVIGDSTDLETVNGIPINKTKRIFLIDLVNFILSKLTDIAPVFTFVSTATIVVQATKTRVVYYWPALNIGYIKLFLEVGTAGWTVNTEYTIGSIVKPTGHTIPTQPLKATRPSAYTGLIDAYFVTTTAGADLKVQPKIIAAGSAYNVYIAGVFQIV